jgi:hypothetical protein
MDFTGIWNAYMGLKRNRRQRERDDVADDQAAITNANNLRTLNNQDRRFSADQDQRGIVNAANEATAVARDKRFTFDEDKLDYQQTQDKIVNARNEGIDSEALKLRNQGSMNSVMNAYAQGGFKGDEFLDNPSNIDSLNTLIRNSPALMAQIKGPNKNYEVAGIKRIPTTTNEDGSKNYRYALMIDTGEVDQERNPILKPLSSTRGTDDPVEAFTADETIKYIEQAILMETGSSVTQDQNDMMTLANTATSPELLGQAQQPVAAQAQAVLDTDTTTPSLANPNPQTVVDDPASGASDPSAVANPVEQEPNDRIASFISEAEAQHGTLRTKDGFGGMGANKRLAMTEQIEKVLLDNVMSATGLNSAEASKLISETRGTAFSGYTGLNKTQGAGRALGQFVDGAVDLGGAIAEGAEDLTDAVGNKFSEFGSAFSSSADDDTTAANTANTTTSTTGGLSPNAKKGAIVADNSIETDTGSTQAVVNKASVMPDLGIGQSLNIVNNKSSKVDTSSMAQRQRAQAMLSLVKQKMIPTPSAKDAANWVKNAKMGANTTKTFTHGDYDYIQELDGLGNVLTTQSTPSQESLARVQRLLAAGDTAGADLEKKRVKDVGTNWTQASEIGMAAVGGNVKKDGEFGSTFGTVPRAGFENYFIGMMRSNANQVQSVLPNGMNINQLTGSNGELAVLAALSKATATALQKGTWTSEDFTTMSGGNWMAILSEYPPAAKSGLYVYGGQINSVEHSLPGFMAANPGMAEPDARAALKKEMSDNAMAAKKAFEEARQS